MHVLADPGGRQRERQLGDDHYCPVGRTTGYAACPLRAVLVPKWGIVSGLGVAISATTQDPHGPLSADLCATPRTSRDDHATLVPHRRSGSGCRCPCLSQGLQFGLQPHRHRAGGVGGGTASDLRYPAASWITHGQSRSMGSSGAGEDGSSRLRIEIGSSIPSRRMFPAATWTRSGTG